SPAAPPNRPNGGGGSPTAGPGAGLGGQPSRKAAPVAWRRLDPPGSTVRRLGRTAAGPLSRNSPRPRRPFVTFFENLSVRNKIFAGYAVLLVPFAALVVMTVIMTRGIMHEFEELR